MHRASDEDVVHDLMDLEMMKRPHLWPNVLLPLVRRERVEGKSDMGFLVADPHKPMVYLENMWMVGGYKKMSEINRKLYDSFEAIGEEWRVD